VKVTYGFVSFTEVEPGEHHSYNQWHLFDHMPEQLPLPGIVFGQRWVLTPALREFMHASPPLDRIHYVTLYLLAEPIAETLADFRALAVDLRGKDRFHEHRTSHLAGAMAVRSCDASPAALVSGEAVPYRPNRGVHVVLSREAIDPVVDQPGVAGVWTFAGDEHSPPELQGVTAAWYWLDGETPTRSLLEMFGQEDLDQTSQEGFFSATFAAVDTFGPWDWFDHPSSTS
jgi:hypothetical protein